MLIFSCELSFISGFKSLTCFNVRSEYPYSTLSVHNLRHALKTSDQSHAHKHVQAMYQT